MTSPTVSPLAPATSTPLTGTASTSQTVGPFYSNLGRDIMLTLTGVWSGSVQFLRSTDKGATKNPVTIGGQAWGTYTANCNEAVWSDPEAAATFYLAINLTSGSVTYRVSQ